MYSELKHDSRIRYSTYLLTVAPVVADLHPLHQGVLGFVLSTGSLTQNDSFDFLCAFGFQSVGITGGKNLLPAR